MMKKQLIWLMTSLLFTMLMLSHGFALADVKPCIQDDADLLTDEEEAALFEVMLPLCEYGTPIFYTTRYKPESIFDRPEEQFYYQQLDHGDSGMLLVINPSRRSDDMLLIFSDGAFYQNILRGYATSGRSFSVTKEKEEFLKREAYHMATNRKYYECARTVFQKTLELCGNDRMGKDMRLYSIIVLALMLTLFAMHLYFSRSQMKGLQNRKQEAATIPVAAESQTGLTITTSDEHREIVNRREKDITIETD